MARIRLHRLYLIATLLATATQGAHAADNQQHGVLDRLQSVETCVLGTTHHEQAVEQRLQTLEKTALGHVQSGAAVKRLHALEQVVGKQHSALLPPVAPTLDTGRNQPLSAPQLAAPQLIREATSADAATACVPTAPSLWGPTGLPEGTPYLTREGEQTILHANATESGANQTPFVNPLIPRRPYQGNGRMNQTAPLPAQTDQMAAQSGQAEQQAAGVSWRSTAGRFAVNAALSAATRRAFSGGGGSVMGALHCPICRLIRF